MPPVPSDKQEQKYKEIFQGWLAECDELHERMIEVLLEQIEPKTAHPSGS